MSFELDKKREHGKAADMALKASDWPVASFHLSKTAEYSIALANRTDGAIRRSYLDEARELVELAELLKSKRVYADTNNVAGVASNAKSTATKASSQHADGEESSGPRSFMLQTKPTQRLADVAGLAEVKQELKERVIDPFRSPEVYAKWKVKGGGGMLMFGPPGNGKTFVAKAIAGELEAAFFAVDASEIKNKYVGETEKNLTRLFDEARAQPRAVMFIDEVDHLLSRVGNQKIGAVSQFLKLADGFVENTNQLLIMAATNKPWSLDPAVLRPGRLGTHIYVGLPDPAAREAIVRFGFTDLPVSEAVDPVGVAARTEGYSGAEIASVCERAKLSAVHRELDRGIPQRLETGDIDEALARVKPRTTKDQIEELLQWRDRGGTTGDRDSDED